MKLDTICSRLERAAIEGWDDALLAEESVSLAEEILIGSKRGQRLRERLEAWKMNRMLGDPAGKLFALEMADQVFRPRDAWRAASQFRYLLESRGAPEYLPLHERIALALASAGSRLAPEVVMSAVTAKMRQESRKVVLPAEEGFLDRHVARRRRMGARLNLNLLGEAILGEEEAARRLEENIRRLESSGCDYISVKISSVFSQVNVLAYEDTLERVKEPLRQLYRAAQANAVQGRPKFVNLDMEEYRDLHLTCDAFQAVLSEDEFRELEAGIVLQAYLPDSFELQKKLTDWACRRRSRGGAGIKLRIVKGANLAMEKVEAAVHGWEQAPYRFKGDVDANFKRMLHYACEKHHAEAVRIGVGSHNLFDVSYALLLREREKVRERVEIEMLEGMANHQARVVEKVGGSLLFYAPVVDRGNFHSAIAYLVRRLDENTAPANFLHDLFGMSPGDEKWNEQRERFLLACAAKDRVSAVSARQQDRRNECGELPGTVFENEADTDWTQDGNRKWIRNARRTLEIPARIGIQIRGRIRRTRVTAESFNPSLPDECSYRYCLGGEKEVEEALQTGVESVGTWLESTGFTPGEQLVRVATELARARGMLIATMGHDAGKAVPEADTEVNEAIDFANYYAQGLCGPGLDDGTSRTPLGVVVVAPPWNFPLAIACGGVVAALAAGNSVILKPPPEAVLTAWRLVELLWKAGISKRALQFLPVPENAVGRKLLTDERVSGVILTGAYDTARLFRDWKPSLRLFAETSGKNSMLITAASDPDQAIKDLVRSAFGHSGQKCSAASLAILEAELYDDDSFLRQLRDAASSLRVGGTDELASVVTPVIRPPDENLSRGLRSLERGEEWLLQPRMVDGNPCLWTPGIRIGVESSHWYRNTECFGPVLGLMRAKDFEDGLRLQNESLFGLTGGLQSLDKREIRRWRAAVEVGNAYINRPITGAIVQRQPFGGWKRSVTGPGAKAGGPNYLLQLSRWQEESLPREGSKVTHEELVDALCERLPEATERIRAAAASYAKWWGEEFSEDHDPSGILGESNSFRYRRRGTILVRSREMLPEEVALVILAARTCKVEVLISAGLRQDKHVELAEIAGVRSRMENSDDFCGWVVSNSGEIERIRALRPSARLWEASHERHLEIIDWPVLANGRIELLHYLREQTVSETRHRYGNIMEDA